jgi:quercetin dioxygenase-like cupin family protein
MQAFKIEFEAMAWDTSHPGARSKSCCVNGARMRLLELTEQFVENDWCHKGHVGFVLEGSLEVDFGHQRVTYRTGDGLCIPSGDTAAHRARALTTIVRLILFEDV